MGGALRGEPAQRPATEDERDRIADTLRLAEALGGEAITLPAGDRNIADDVIGYAQANNVTQIVIGKSERTRWFEILHGSVVHDLVRRSGNISVHVIAGDTIAGDPIPKKSVARRRADDPSNPWPYTNALQAVALALGLRGTDPALVRGKNVDLVFLTGVVGVAVRLGLWPSLLASVASSLCYNYFFLPPIYTFTITDPTNVAAFIFFTIVAIVVSTVAARGRTQAIAATERARVTEALYSFSRKLAGAGTLDDVLWATAYQTALMLKVRVMLLLPENGSIAVKAAYPPEDILDDADLAAAKWAWENDRAAGRGSDTLPGAQTAVPADAHRTRRRRRDGNGQRQAGSPAHARSTAAPGRTARSGRARDRARSPGRGDGPGRAHRRNRTSALGVADLDFARSEDAACRRAGRGRSAARYRLRSLAMPRKPIFWRRSSTNSERLNRFIANLLDMTKLESGAVTPNVALHDIGEIIGSALRRASRILSHHNVELEIAPDLPMLELDAVLFEQALFNLLDNAAKYAPAETTIRIQSWRDAQSVCLRVLDEGGGIPANDLDHIFDKFYRAQKTDQVRAGTGLGLAISRGFVEAMHGTIIAANRTDRSGAAFTISLPIPHQRQNLDAAA